MSKSKTMEVIVKAVDKATDVLEGIKQTTTKTTESMKVDFTKLGLGITAAGTAMLGLAQTQASKTEQTRKLASAMGMTNKEMRSLANEISNVTFPLEEVLDVMELGRQQGIKSGEQMKEYATLWDTVGSATGESSASLAEAAVALNAIGISAMEQEKALSAFGFIAQETTSSVGEFLTFIERTGPQLRELSLDVNDTAAIIGLLEKEFGMARRVARQEFRKAVNESGGDLGALMQTLGITQEQFQKYRAEVEACSDVMQEYADINESVHTIFDRFKQQVSELTYKYGDYIAVAGNVGSVMMGIGSTITTLSTIHKTLTLSTVANTVANIKYNASLISTAVGVHALTAAEIAQTAVTKVATVATTAFGTALNFALGPIGLVILGITALIAGIVLLYKNWDKVSAFLVNTWNNFKEVFAKVWESIVEICKKVSQVILAILFPIPTLIIKNWDKIKDFVGNLIETLKERFNTFKNFILNIWNAIRDGFAKAFEGIIAPFKWILNTAIRGLNMLINGLNKVKINVPNWVPVIGGKTFGFSIPNIPQLAEGGYIRNRPGGILANIGEGNEPEIVSPVSKMREIVRQESGGKGVMNLYLQVNGRTLAEVLGVEIRNEVIARLGGA